MHSIKDEIEVLTPRPYLDNCLLRQLEEQLGGVSKDLSDIGQDIVSSEEEENLLDTEATLCKSFFNLSVQIKRLLQDRPSNPSTPESEKRVKLSKIDISTLNGNILH